MVDGLIDSGQLTMGNGQWAGDNALRAFQSFRLL